MCRHYLTYTRGGGACRTYGCFYRAYISLYFDGGHPVAFCVFIADKPYIRRLNSRVRRFYGGGKPYRFNKTNRVFYHL
jgi:hypothetical protein